MSLSVDWENKEISVDVATFYNLNFRGIKPNKSVFTYPADQFSEAIYDIGVNNTFKLNDNDIDRSEPDSDFSLPDYRCIIDSEADYVLFNLEELCLISRPEDHFLTENEFEYIGLGEEYRSFCNKKDPFNSLQDKSFKKTIF